MNIHSILARRLVFTGHEFGWSWGDERRIAWEFECFPLPLGSIGRFK